MTDAVLHPDSNVARKPDAPLGAGGEAVYPPGFATTVTVAVTTWELPARSGLGADWAMVVE